MEYAQLTYIRTQADEKPKEDTEGIKKRIYIGMFLRLGVPPGPLT